MTFAESLIQRIDSPEHPDLQALQQKAIQNVEPTLYESDISDVTDDIIRKLSYIYYYDWVSDDPEYMWLVQDPDNFGDRHLGTLRENNPLASDCNLREQVSVYRTFGKNWLIGCRDGNFSEGVLTALDELELIDLEGTWKEYLAQERFYRDVYLTDVVKYRTEDYDRDEQRTSYEELLKEEIREVGPSLIFSFGSPALRTVRKNMNSTPLQGLEGRPITECHGTLLRVEEPIDTYVLPLVHMSPNNRGQPPIDEYVKRMRAGIETWKELQ